MSRKSFSESEARKKLGELVTYPYSLYVRKCDKIVTTSSDIVNKKGKRKDNRSCKDHRKIC